MESTAWYRSLTIIILASLLFPPLGLVLLWTRPGTDTSKKVFGSLGIGIVVAVYVFVLFGPSLFVRNPDAEAHYDELERHRSQQLLSPPDAHPTPNTTEPKTEATAPESAKNANVSHGETASKAAVPKAARNYWTDFRGPGRDGRYDELNIKTDWASEGLPLLWRQPVGGGYASFVVADGLAFTIEQRRRQEVVAAYDVETGRETWTHGWNAEFIESAGGDGPRATPTWDDGRVYALGATGEFRCLEAKTGKLIWSRNILTDNHADNLDWGMAASPLIVEDKVIVLPGGRNGKSVVAYNKLTGQPIWKVLDDKQAYTSPMLVGLAGMRQLLVVSARRAMGLTPEDGSLLWDFPWVTDYGVNSAQPIILSENRFFISAGYGHGAAVVEVTRTDKGFVARAVWANNIMKNKFNSSVLYNGYIYGFDEGIFACVDAQTGERKWKGGRYGYGQVLLAGGHLIVITDTGDLVLLKATPDKHTELARFSAIEGKTWNHPAIAGGRLLVRNANQMACFNIAN